MYYNALLNSLQNDVMSPTFIVIFASLIRDSFSVPTWLVVLLGSWFFLDWSLNNELNC